MNRKAVAQELVKVAKMLVSARWRGIQDDIDVSPEVLQKRDRHLYDKVMRLMPGSNPDDCSIHIVFRCSGHSNTGFTYGPVEDERDVEVVEIEDVKRHKKIKMHHLLAQRVFGVFYDEVMDVDIHRNTGGMMYEDED